MAASRAAAADAKAIVDCSGIGAFDSAAVAVLLALKRRAAAERPDARVRRPAGAARSAARRSTASRKSCRPEAVGSSPRARRAARSRRRVPFAVPSCPPPSNSSMSPAASAASRRSAGVSFAVEQGEFFGLLGPNGAGKTTLISIAAGLTRADAGTARILGHDVVRDYRAARRALGVVPQELVFDPFFSVRETLEIQSGYFGIRDNGDWIDEILHHLDLTSKADANMRSLSGGMKRRVLVGPGARAQAAGDRARRADRGRRRRAAAEPVGIHPQAQPRRAHDHPDDALSRGSRGAVRAHRDAEGRQGRRARHQAQPPVALCRHHRAPRRRSRAGGVAVARAARGRRRSSSSRSTTTPISRCCCRRCARKGSRSASSRSSKPISRTCS